MKLKQNFLLWVLTICIFILSVGCSRETRTINTYELPQSESEIANEYEESISQIVYRTKTGTHYHEEGCQYLLKSKIETSLSEAENRGLKPCSKCIY